MNKFLTLQTSVEKVPHYTGAGLAFICGVTYCWIQTRISWKLRRKHGTEHSTRTVSILQLILCISSTVLLVICILIKHYYWNIYWSITGNSLLIVRFILIIIILSHKSFVTLDILSNFSTKNTCETLCPLFQEFEEAFLAQRSKSRSQVCKSVQKL